MVLGHFLRTSERNWLPVIPGMRSSETTTSMSLPARIIRPCCAESAVKISNCVTVETAHQGRSEIRLVVDQK